MNILIADDNADDRKMLCYTLEHHGCTVIKAKDGQEGFDLAKRHKPDFIVSDALMPGMDGFQFLRSLKADPEFSSVPFLFYIPDFPSPKNNNREKEQSGIGAAQTGQGNRDNT